MAAAARLKRLQGALVEVLPESSAWVPQGGPASGRPSSAEPEYWLGVASPVRPERQHLVILLRSDGDVQVEYHLAAVEGSPFEALFSIPDDREAEALEEVARFVRDLLTERLVLAMDPRRWRGGRLFLLAEQLSERRPGELAWVTSWRGTYDWHP